MGFGPIHAHTEAFFADGDTIVSDGEVVLVNRRSATFAIKVNEGLYAMSRAILIIGHGIVGRIQEELSDICFRKELLHGEEVIPKAMGIMSGGGAKQRKKRQVIFGIRGSEHIEIITEIMPFSVRIPANVAVGLVVDTVALTVPDALFKAVAGAGLTLSGAGIDRRSITGDCEMIQVDKSLVDGNIQELGFKDLKQSGSRMELFWRLYFELGQEVIDSDFFYRRGLFPFFIRLFGLLFWRVNRIRDVIAIRKPQSVEEIIKSTCAGSIPN